MRAGVYGRQSRGKKKSITEQINLGTTIARERSWLLDSAHVYQDKSSASRFARAVRDDWPRVREAVRSGEIDVLILWESSRGDREPETWLNFLSDCRKSNVKIYIIESERLYDMTITGDWEGLASEGIKNAVESEKISKRVKRGHTGSAQAGRPSHGRPPYGYRRVYNSSTGELIGQEPDPATAPIVRTIFAKLALGYAISDLSRQTGVHRVKIRNIALNPAYVGLRVYNGQTFPGDWPPLVEPEVFYTVQRILTAPERVTTRPGGLRWLLSGLLRCGVCTGPMGVTGGRYYRCRNGCTRIVREETDKWITRTIKAYLSQPAVYKRLAQASEDAAREVTEARNEAATLRGELNMWRKSAAKRLTSPESLAVIEADLTQQIRAAERRAEEAEVPAVLRGYVGPGVDVAARWEAAPLTARRAIIQQIMEISVIQAPPNVGRFDSDRLVIRRRGAAAGESAPAPRR